MFWWTIFVCDMIVPITMIIAGIAMWKHPPKDINGMIGYRTRRSMKNIDTWRFAHEYCGRTWWKVGWIVLIISALAHLPYYNDTDHVIGILCAVICTMQCAVLIASVIPTENALKNTFTDDGTRK